MGGGVALLYASKVLENVQMENFDQQHGLKIVRKAVQAPCKRIVDNAGFEGAVVVEHLLSQKDHKLGYNAYDNTYQNMEKAGILDPTKVVRSALLDAASISSLMITTESAIVDMPEEKAVQGNQMSGMGGMNGMMQY